MQRFCTVRFIRHCLERFGLVIVIVIVVVVVVVERPNSRIMILVFGVFALRTAPLLQRPQGSGHGFLGFPF